MKKVLAMLIVAGLALATGCCSLATNRALQAESAIEIRADNSGATIGFDVFNLRSVREHPWLSAGAALADVVIGYGIYELGDNNGWWGDNGDDDARSTPEAAGAQPQMATEQLTVSVAGDGNVVQLIYKPVESEAGQ